MQKAHNHSYFCFKWGWGRTIVKIKNTSMGRTIIMAAPGWHQLKVPKLSVDLSKFLVKAWSSNFSSELLSNLIVTTVDVKSRGIVIRGEYPSGLSDLSGAFRVTTTAESLRQTISCKREQNLIFYFMSVHIYPSWTLTPILAFLKNFLTKILP